MILFRRQHIRRNFTVSVVAGTETKDLHFLNSKSESLNQNSYLENHINVAEANIQLKQLVRTGHLKDARELFDQMPEKDEVSWTNVISGYVNASDIYEALLLFSKIRLQPELRIDPFVLSLGLKACGLDMNYYYGTKLHGYSVKTGLVNSVFVGSALLDMYMKIGEIGRSCKVFDEMPTRNAVTWTAVITGLVRAGYNEEGLVYFSKMGRSKVEYDSFAYAIALKATADSGALNHGRAIHTQTLKKGFEENSFVANSLASMYNKCGKLDYGLYMFGKMRTPDVVSWTTIITSYVQMGEEERGLQAFRRMHESNVIPNEYTFAAVISGCANLSMLKWGQQLHARVLCVGFLNSLSVANSIMTMYSKCGELASVSKLFCTMIFRDIISWSTIIAASSQACYGEEAFRYLSRMRSEGPKPNEFALASVLSVCGSMAILEQGKQLHAHVLSVGLEQTSMICSALIIMYAKCGSIMEASKIFMDSLKDDIISWTAMISGYAEHGHSQEAIELFENIQKVGLRPDPVTFIGVLTACSHAGMVDLGFHYFNSMSKDYHISPTKEHYGCMIDLLCRAGRLSDAEGLIRSMPFQRDDVVWSTLLRACRIHGDVDCGQRAAAEVLKLDPNCAGTHITLANIYAAKGKWREAANIRMLMKSKGVVKEPGWSSIKVKGSIFAFVAGDRSHPQGEDIFSMLELLASRMEIYILELEHLVTDVEE
ncbi:putative pentatricopeptide repeat-containing protein At3g47840 [Momordica charantia]|uniref:Pentatricopeptide repeat-containing protein At3g47840 n=1 Tax=Momordica charantia TaxID=3673 RepID=A0A6J1DSK9_MOMCH|nr:putative pentatricopeptide repeat-containing protein At3g47840 [Momordica charantia]XP_022157248.1 putative pentatricopeptide repeat-containing protein At3g47840 [Momordica charantia]XP_022157249.1 putative pentatricopeptide repeat-containing protein At3g47840 [Momordica charantia]XP_022157250.1 putative pentatricopeptide repeat-containing protein At3g47840 [Momordica charantia]XP_022157251.1 putative pentatricopeptide repeat-containing protein At3g47840 [Momordica charantia]XP_022157252.1 